MGTPSQLAGFDEDEWEDIDYIPLHLRPPVGSKYLTVIDVTGVHFVLLQPCQCMNAESYHKQLLCAKLYPSTFDKPSMAFTFLVLDDFLRDNVECGTSGMNYYSKLHRVTSTVFPHLVPDQYRELLWVAQQWHLLKLLKWSGYQGNSNHSTKGDLALFCVACPQPGIDLSPQDNLDDWRYTRTVVMDGNFKAEHMHEWRPHDQLPLHISWNLTVHQKSTCNNHKANQSGQCKPWKTQLYWSGCYRLQLNMDYSLCNALSYNMNGIRNVICFYDINCTYMKNLQRQVDNSTFLEIAPSLRIVVGIGMWHVHRTQKGMLCKIFSLVYQRMTSPHRQELLDFQMNDSNFMKMIQMISSLSWKLKVAQAVVTLAQEAFDRLNEAVPSSQQENWWRQEEAALKDCIHDPSVMDIFEIQVDEGCPPASGMHHGATSWLTRRLVIEEAEVTLAISQKAIGPNPSDLKRLVIARHADRVAAECKTFIADSRIYLQMDTTLDDSEECDRNHEEACQNILVEDDISSNGGNSDCSADDMQDTDTLADPTSPTLPAAIQSWEMELELRIAQANDALHGLRLALADKAVIFRGVVRTAMIALGAKPELLAQVSGAPKITPNDKDTSSKSWLTEFSTIHLQKFTESTGSVLKQEKIVGKRRKSLLTSEFQWVINYFLTLFEMLAGEV
ncbi:hypothetical protein EV401DRAFT_1889996 [Pisolithus croceorrhizus]|nr:hypothetical protein EV401DRAFT_1889996 [Pisolithus croceorrhizus]